jgi:hypothetical protein
LLQASGQVFGNYLEKVRRFQEREADLGRPVRVVVTSRVTLIDKARVPSGSTVVRLLEFDEPRQSKWVSLWNEHNEAYFTESGNRAFAVPGNPRIHQLSEQPLLLLMLAIYDSQDNALHKHETIDQPILYHNLLVRFIERERSKGERASDFLGLTDDERREVVDRDLRRLGIAALGMFNRQALHITRGELDKDIAHFEAGEGVTVGPGVRLTEADLLLGSFFFIHESRAADPQNEGEKAEQDRDSAEVPATFEFLHNTFGEFLAADFLLREILKETQIINELRRARRFLASPLDQRLSTLSDAWFSCLVHTALHTRPVILEMMRDWFPHCSGFHGRKRDDIVTDLDEIIDRQVTELFAANKIPGTERDSPYPVLPTLGSLAVYSLNLILIRLILGEGQYLWRLDFGEGSHRAWQQVTSLWRTWFSMDGLSGLTAILTSTREGNAIVLAPKVRFVSSAAASRLEAIFSLSSAIGDDSLAGLSGLHVYDVLARDDIALSEVARTLETESIDISPSIALRRLWLDPGQATPRLLSSYFEGVPGKVVPVARGIVDAVARASRRMDVRVHLRQYFGARDPRNFPSMEHQTLDSYVELYASLEPRWLEYAFRRSGGSRRRLSRRSASYKYIVPMLRVALSNGDFRSAQVFISQISQDPDILEGAAAEVLILTALLAWRSGVTPLLHRCLRILFRPTSKLPSLVSMETEILSEFIEMLAGDIRPDSSIWIECKPVIITWIRETVGFLIRTSNDAEPLPFRFVLAITWLDPSNAHVKKLLRRSVEEDGYVATLDEQFALFHVARELHLPELVFSLEDSKRRSTLYRPQVEGSFISVIAQELRTPYVMRKATATQLDDLAWAEGVLRERS